MVASEQVEILEAFIEYLKPQNRIDFLANEKSELFFISKLSTADDSAYEVMQVQSTKHLCSILMNAFVDDYMSELQIMSIDSKDLEILNLRLEQYLDKLPQFRAMMQDAFHQVVSLLLCNTKKE
ncbi:MAG: hypothetical protein J6B76_11175 [Peptococcaceae bacterium]|nr:hypothetical protein [Peptococcaceae bacterium]